MFNDLQMIKIKGGFFENTTYLELFKNNQDRISFIYGRNGSGKTSISNAILDLKNSDFSNFEEISLIDPNMREINISNQDCDKIFVFNERFIDSKIRFSSDGMNTIVMFGKQIELDDEIKKLSETRENLKIKYEKVKNLDTEYSEPKNKISPLFYLEKISEKLKNDNSWASREQNIKNLSRKSSVNDSIIKSIVSLPFCKNIKDLITELDKNISFLSTVSPETSKYNVLEFNYQIAKDYEEKLKSLLAKKLEKPTLTEREKKIFDAITDGLQNNIDSAKEHFSHEESNYCPYCFQEVSKEYKNRLLSEFDNVLNENVKVHKSELDFMILNKIDYNFSIYNSLNLTLCNKILGQVDKINKRINIINTIINDKKTNIYTPVSIGNVNIFNDYEILLKLIKKLDIEIKSYNQKVDNISKTIAESCELNKKIARNEIDSDLEIYIEQKEAMYHNKEEMVKLQNQIRELDIELNGLNSQKKNINIALDRINKDLEYIFFEKDRLSLAFENDKYIVLSHKNKVELSKISVGERNAIALCYFFTQILENTDENNEYTNDFLLIIDDPISSFDFENKIGIYSFLRNKLNKILFNNATNKCIVLTHELEAMMNFEKYYSEFKDKGIKISYLYLQNKQIQPFNNEIKNNYTKLLNIMYDYAINPSDTNELIIGNTMRKVLEAFSTFESKNSIESFMRDEDILGLIPSNLKEYFQNFMYRLVLNGESHFGESAMIYPESDFFAYISTPEKQITAKNLLCFMYIINPLHIKKQFDNKKDCIENIETWIKTLDDK